MSDEAPPDKVTNVWDVHAAKLREGHRIKEDAKHDLGVIDPREIVMDNAPAYTFGQLPGLYEDYVIDNIAEFGGDPAAYACAFLSFSCSAFHSTVLYNQRPSKPTLLKSPNDHSITLAPSGYVKSGLMKDLRRPLDQFQDAMRKPVKRKRGEKVKVAVLRRGSVEGVLRQVADNEGERLVVWNDEGMGLLRGAGAHHSESAVEMVSDMATSLYDGESYSKALADESKSRHIDKCLGNLMLAAVLDDFIGWKGLPIYTRLGAMARTTVGVISRPIERNVQMRIKGAEEAMTEMMGNLRKLRHVHFVMDKEAEQVWEGWLPKKERAIKTLDRTGAAPPGFVEWCRKYDSRILSLASVFAAYGYIGGTLEAIVGDVIPEAQPEDKIEAGGQKPEPVRLRTVMISEAILKMAINFVEKFLLPTQWAFYEKAQGASEFGKELLHWVMFRLWSHTPEGDNIITRSDLVFKGPSSVRPRGGINDAVKAKASRWIRALLDHGYIEVFRPEGSRVFRVPRLEEDEANFKIRDAFFIFFADDIEVFKSMYEGRLAELGRGTNGGVPV